LFGVLLEYGWHTTYIKGTIVAKKLHPISVWALAAGGMVGGGIYTVLGVVIAVSAQWAWLVFLVIGILAVTAAYSYVFLSPTSSMIAAGSLPS